jgi:diguanylate cyclase (GGDEF)-like protein
MAKNNTDDQQPAKPSHLKYFFLIFLTIGGLLAGAISVLYHLETNDYRHRLEIEESFSLDLEKETIRKSLEAVASDLMFLTRQNELNAFFKNGDPARLAAVAREYGALARHKGVYDQIRYIDRDGMEIVRVNDNNNRPAAVPPENLQSKADRYYFKDTIALGPGDIFVSPFDLNIENGRLEIPFKPMIRFGTPVYDSQQRKRGIIVFNYKGRQLLNAIKRAGTYAAGNIMLVNADGYWLSSPTPEDEWGFMVEGRAHRKFQADFARAWERIATSPECQILNDSGLFTATTIHPLEKGSKSGRGSGRVFGNRFKPVNRQAYYWKVISHIPRSTLYEGTRGLMVKLFFLAVGLLTLATIPSWLIAQAMVRRRMHQWELYQSAHFDRLTQLPNRGLFLDRLDQTLAQSVRYKRSFALLFIDLDGFKAVNDNLGHDAGDAVLIETAERFSNVVRVSDTVARLGGDEFTIVLNAIVSSENAETVAKKILDSLAAPFIFRGQQATIGASIGISIYPDHGSERDLLLKKSDEAMYRAKQAGKNGYRFSAG